MKFRVKCGGYVDDSGKRHESGAIVVSDVPLDEKFGAEAFEPVTVPKAKPVVEKKELVQEEPEDSDLGYNVTREYPQAVAKGIRVYNKGSWYRLTKDGKPLTEKALRGSEVADAIAEF